MYFEKEKQLKIRFNFLSNCTLKKRKRGFSNPCKFLPSTNCNILFFRDFLSDTPFHIQSAEINGIAIERNQCILINYNQGGSMGKSFYLPIALLTLECGDKNILKY
jgi:hypothetical protein